MEGDETVSIAEKVQSTLGATSMHLTMGDSTSGEQYKYKQSQKPEKELLIVRQNCLAHADNWIKIWADIAVHKLKPNELEIIYFEFAEKCEAWVMRS